MDAGCVDSTRRGARALMLPERYARFVTRGSRVRVGSILVRCVRFDELLAFWQAALGYVPREPPEDGWVVLTDPTGAGPNISLDRVSEDRLPPLGELSRVHLDLYTTDQQAEVERLLGLGATRYEREYGPDEDFVVHVDPDGNRFCVVAKPDAS
jgi:Glyoxalase-like domain